MQGVKIRFMITVFNRKEAFAGYLDGLNKVRDILDANGINYSYSSSAIFFSAGLSQGLYYLYVKKKDYDQACHILGNGNIR